ncbi:MAG: arginase family protein, partial [Pseudomonadota bacterium]
MHPQTCHLIGAPVQSGASQPGCIMGPDAFRTAGLGGVLSALGHRVDDRGNVAPGTAAKRHHPNTAIRALDQTSAWIAALQAAAAETPDMPIFMGGDHSLAAGTVPGMAKRAAALGQPQFVLWLDAHPDIHTLDTTCSG